MSHPIESMVGTVSGRDVITLTQGAAGPDALAPPQSHRDRLSPTAPWPLEGIFLCGVTMLCPEQPDLHCTHSDPRRGPKGDQQSPLGIP